MIGKGKGVSHTIILATVLHGELQLDHLTKHLEVIRPGGIALGVLDGPEDVLECIPVGSTIAFLEIVAGSLMNRLGCPECAIGNINVDCQTSTGTNRCLGLVESQLKIKQRINETHITQSHGRIDTSHSNDTIVEGGRNTLACKETTLDGSVGLGRTLTDQMIKEVC